MMRIKFLFLLITFFVIPQSLWAKVHDVSYNVSTVVDLHENDEINLVNKPMGWGYSRIVLGINSMPSFQLFGNMVVNGCSRGLQGYYKEIEFAYTDKESIVYHGPAQKLPMQWWVDAAPVLSSCEILSEMSREDSIAAVLYHFADSVYSAKNSGYRDMGDINSDSFFEGRSVNFKITKLPDWFYNRIYVQVESLDGRELNGFAYVGGKKVEISGWSSMFSLIQKTSFSPTFELAFPEYRKVKLKWWAEVGTPAETEIVSKERSLTKDSVEVEYSFDGSLYTEKTLQLAFDRRKFKDGRVPKVKKLSFDPQGPIQDKEVAVRGDIYDFQANLNPGDSVVIAIPLNFNYRPGEDSVTIEHFIEEENRWIEEPVDSIVGNYAYFKVGHFSWLRSLCRTVVSVVTLPAKGACALARSDECMKAVDKFNEGAANFIADGLAAAGNGVLAMLSELERLLCFDSDDKKTMREIWGYPKNSDWDIEQGKISQRILDENLNVITYLKLKRVEGLKKLSDVVVSDNCGGDRESCQWDITAKNLEILLANAIVSGMEPDPKEPVLGSNYYVFSDENGKVLLTSPYTGEALDYDDYFMSSSGLLEDATWFINGAKSCTEMFNYDGRIAKAHGDFIGALMNMSYTGACKALVGGVLDEVSHLDDIPTCLEFLEKMVESKLELYESPIDNHQNKLIHIADAMVRVSLLAWLDKTSFRKYSFWKYWSAYKGVRTWLELAGPFLDYNNIAVKAYGSVALFEYIHYGTDENLKMVNKGLNHHYGENGGYSEGTGYSQYIWDDLTYVLASMKDAYRSTGEKLEISEKFLMSPDYMFEFSRPTASGLIPVEIDDGVTYNPDYRVWSKLKDDPKYLAMSEKYPLRDIDGKKNVLEPFGFPGEELYVANRNLPDRGLLWGAFKDGIGLISAVNKLGDTVALSMIAENGAQWTHGQSHDQQDNLSITLSSAKNGFLIQDRGYTGFSARDGGDVFHRYDHHNVLIGINGAGQPDNKVISFAETVSRLEKAFEIEAGLFDDFLVGGWEFVNFLRGSSVEFQFRVEGGYEANVREEQINEPENGIIGYSAYTAVEKSVNPFENTLPFFVNYRTILYFGDNFWVIDRPTSEGWGQTRWLANSPLDKWQNLKINLYGSSLTPIDGTAGEVTKTDFEVSQNMRRGDFIFQVLRLSSYSIFDASAKTYVMNYAVGDDAFSKVELDCPADHQCFANIAGDKRLIVPPQGSKFDLCEALPNNECSGDAFSTGITMLVKQPNLSWKTSWVLDGGLYAYENKKEVALASATVTRKNYMFVKKDGQVVNGVYSNAYLPAIPLLLLR